MTSKFALVIANTEYQDASFAKLTAPGKDAEEFAQVLRDLAAFDAVNVLLNEGEGKTRRSIARFFADRKHDDLLLLYFSGHGVRNEQGQLFLAANDTEISILEASGIPSDFVTQSMNHSRSQRQLLILDCCNSGAFAHGSKSPSGVGKSMGIATAFEGSGFGRVVLTATDATQYAWEGDKVIGDTQKSVFTHFLIEGLRGEADRDGDGRIDVDELYDYAYEEVVRRTPKQTPGKWSYKQQGDIILRENLKPREIKPAPLPSELLEMLAHPNSGVRRAGLQELIGLLDGKHQGLARAAREKLLEIAENDDSLTLRRSADDALKARGFEIEPLVPIEIPTEQQKEVKKPETPIVRSPRETHPPHEQIKEKIPRSFPDWKTVTTKFNLRIMGGLIAALAIIFLVIKFGPVLRNSLFPGIGSTKTGKDGMTMVYVPAGEFTMGSDSQSDELPIHKVTLDAFWIDQTEVTNAMYAKCMDAGRCKLPSDTTHYDDSNYANHPVVYVSWDQAIEYCAWAGRRLPTEAEWEKAARGENASIYPWGNDAPNNNLLNYNNAVDDTTEVGTYPDGASIYGALDMAGNVWEWVSSLYQSYPYDAKDGREDLSSSDARVLRGGSLYDLDNLVRSAYHGRVDPTAANYNAGFRCAISANRQADITPFAQASTNIPSATQTSQPTKTDTPSPTETLVSPDLTLGIGSTMIGKDGMTLLYVPAGEFMMGSEDGRDEERPIHTVSLDAYWIDQTEVTNAQYAECVQSSSCQPPNPVSSQKHSNYFGNPEYDNYPVIFVSWDMAKAYCEWSERRLPTEAEWEKAARTDDARKYPWGNAFPNSNLANYGSVAGDTTQVGQYPNGISVYGAMDMAGNVSEWVADRYEGNYYSNSPASNPLGPDSGDYQVARGGSWKISDARYITSWIRERYYPGQPRNFIGFRCAISASAAIEPEPSMQPTNSANSSITPSLGIGSTLTDDDSMTLLYVPAGEFTMGSTNGNANERPAHKVYLDAFWIDKTEITNIMYAQCEDAGVCRVPFSKESNERPSYYGNPNFDNYPVIYIEWDMAKTYCEWAGRRLPTEAEWEKAARGNDARRYPWGNTAPNESLLNYKYLVRDTTEVGKYPNGAGPYGALDMAGNVWEWVADWYDEDYYATEGESAVNPLGPTSGEDHVLRGGAWFSNENYVSSTYRGRLGSVSTPVVNGFRCAMDTTP